jgi:hypothetical protein
MLTAPLPTACLKTTRLGDYRRGFGYKMVEVKESISMGEYHNKPCLVSWEVYAMLVGNDVFGYSYCFFRIGG